MNEEKLSQKWCIVSLLEDTKENYLFHKSEWPLHITLAGVHDINWNEKLIAEFGRLLTELNSFTAKTTEQGILGTTEVIFINKSDSLMNLHSQVINFLYSNGAIFNNPEWQKEGYIPHSTVQKHSSVEVDKELTLDNVALVDMFPDQDGSMRKITKIFKLR